MLGSPPKVSAPVVPIPEPISVAHALRRKWKPQKERLQKIRTDHPTTIRFHRACSWLQRAEEIGDDDLRLVSLWIGFNALYGQWDGALRQPAADRQAWKQFLERLLALDTSGHLASVLQDHKPEVLQILEDEFLSSYFWEDPGPQRAGKSRKVMFDARTWYLAGRWGAILDRVMERIYFQRCQLVHGAATHGGKLNRVSLGRCAALLGSVLEGVLCALSDHGADDDWGMMCYPPIVR